MSSSANRTSCPSSISVERIFLDAAHTSRKNRIASVGQPIVLGYVHRTSDGEPRADTPQCRRPPGMGGPQVSSLRCRWPQAFSGRALRLSSPWEVSKIADVLSPSLTPVCGSVPPERHPRVVGGLSTSPHERSMHPLPQTCFRPSSRPIVDQGVRIITHAVIRQPWGQQAQLSPVPSIVGMIREYDPQQSAPRILTGTP